MKTSSLPPELYLSCLQACQSKQDSYLTERSTFGGYEVVKPYDLGAMSPITPSSDYAGFLASLNALGSSCLQRPKQSLALSLTVTPNEAIIHITANDGQDTGTKHVTAYLQEIWLLLRNFSSWRTQPTEDVQRIQSTLSVLVYGHGWKFFCWRVLKKNRIRAYEAFSDWMKERKHDPQFKADYEHFTNLNVMVGFIRRFARSGNPPSENDCMDSISLTIRALRAVLVETGPGLNSHLDTWLEQWITWIILHTGTTQSLISYPRALRRYLEGILKMDDILTAFRIATSNQYIAQYFRKDLRVVVIGQRKVIRALTITAADVDKMVRSGLTDDYRGIDRTVESFVEAMKNTWKTDNLSDLVINQDEHSSSVTHPRCTFLATLADSCSQRTKQSSKLSATPSSDKIIIHVTNNGTDHVEVASYLQEVWILLSRITAELPEGVSNEDEIPAEKADSTDALWTRVREAVYVHSWEKFCWRVQKINRVKVYDVFSKWMRQHQHDFEFKASYRDFEAMDNAIDLIASIVRKSSDFPQNGDGDALQTAVKSLQPLLVESTAGDTTGGTQKTYFDSWERAWKTDSISKLKYGNMRRYLEGIISLENTLAILRVAIFSRHARLHFGKDMVLKETIDEQTLAASADMVEDETRIAPLIHTLDRMGYAGGYEGPANCRFQRTVTGAVHPECTLLAYHYNESKKCNNLRPYNYIASTHLTCYACTVFFAVCSSAMNRPWFFRASHHAHYWPWLFPQLEEIGLAADTDKAHVTDETPKYAETPELADLRVEMIQQYLQPELRSMTPALATLKSHPKADQKHGWMSEAFDSGDDYFPLLPTSERAWEIDK